MPAWLTESNPTLYFVLAVVAVACAVGWVRTRRRHYLIAAIAAALGLLGSVAIHLKVESDTEQMVRKLGEISRAVRARRLDQVFEHVADDFLVKGVDKAGFRAYCDRMQSGRQADEFVAWDFEPGVISKDAKRGELSFLFKVRGSFGETPPGYFAKTFWSFRPSDGQWRIQSFELFNSMAESKTPISIPGWGR